jgi:hypothetical protein
MPDLVVTVPEPTDTSAGLTVTITRNANGAQMIVSYERNGVTRIAALQPSDFTGAQRTQIQTVVQFILAAAKAEMGF